MATSSLPPCVKLTGGKRGATGPLIVTTSDEDSASDGESFPMSSPRATLTSRISPRGNITDSRASYAPDTYPNLKLDLSRIVAERNERQAETFRHERSEIAAHTKNQPQTTRTCSSPLPSPGVTSQQAFDGYEHDHDYDNVASPTSSTASGPVYVRPPGFKHHAQEIRRKKKKPAGLLDHREGLKSRAPTPPKLKTRREPLPMRLRALPQSFWKQPNNLTALSPGNMFSSLPPLSYSKDEESIDMRPITPPEEREKNKKHQKPPERKVIVTGDTDLFLKHLFADVIDEKKTTNNNNAAHLRRGRPPKKMHIMHKSNTKGLLSGDDPFMLESAVTQKLFPQLSIESSTRQLHGAHSSLQLITLREGDKSVTLPSLSVEQNYSQMLSELVMNI